MEEDDGMNGFLRVCFFSVCQTTKVQASMPGSMMGMDGVGLADVFPSAASFFVSNASRACVCLLDAQEGSSIAARCGNRCWENKPEQEQLVTRYFSIESTSY